MLIKRTKNEITLSGGAFGMADLKLDIASFSNKSIELVKATQIAVALDDSQYLLCKTISNIRDDDQLRNDCQRIRLMLIMSFSQLRAILSTINEVSDASLQQELARWIEYMSELNKQSISLIGPGPATISKGSKIFQLMKYQNIDEKQLQEALGLL